MHRLLFFLFFFFVSSFSFGQYRIKGKVTDAETGDPIPFASVLAVGTGKGMNTDFEGGYELILNTKADSIQVSYLGYFSQTKALQDIPEQTINFQLRPSDFELEAFVFEAGENPAFEIIRRAVAKRDDFDKRSLEAYETKNYTKIEIDIDHLSEDFRQRKTVQKVTSVLDSIRQLTNDEGEKILPVFFSETLSRFYFRNNPLLKKEIVEKSKVTGVGITDGSTTSQITGSAFQEYNFYKNWLTILEKDFISPIADGWKTFYDYDLMDSVLVGTDSCYQLQVYPRREQDLAFSGTIWINKNTYALKQVDLTIPKTANLNFIERIKIQQELEPTIMGPLIPSKTRVQIKIGQVTPNTAGLLAKFYTATDSVFITDPKPTSFFNNSVELKPDFGDATEDFWTKNRIDPLSSEELAVLQMVDTLKKIPVIRFYSEGLKFFATGFLPVGKIDLGPWTEFGNYNNVEGLRGGFGLRTNYKFSTKWAFQGYLAYGFKDQRFKYSVSAKNILDRKRWTTIELSSSKEIDQVGLEMESLEGNSVFLAASRFGTLRRPFISSNQQLKFQREFFKGFLFQAGIRLSQFDPLFDFYYLEKGTGDYRSEFQTSELRASLRYGRDEIILINDNERASLGPSKWPIFEFKFARGIQWLGGEIDYHKLGFYLYQRLNMGLFGVSRYELDAGKVFGEVPYPILKNHLGNGTAFYTTAAFNTMNFNEFASDQFISLRYRHFFEGFLLNRIPLMRKLKWRAVANANILFGSVSDKNISNAPTFDPQGNPIETFGRLEPTKPYLELGYGIENIFKFFRVDFFHRMTYLDSPNANNFAVKVSAQIIL
ncbi:MAG: carboxypeptidase-like regulatory domain-containing protein [Cyclobacteriaceae bacterium]|nr:carboxypeptidase-like regulatory domain-containing protein [Cyclobacteriaceae bacterium]